MKFTFLGASDAALSMFIQILHDNYGANVDVDIIKNIDVDSKDPFLIEDISTRTTFYKEWQPSYTTNYLIGVNKANTKKIVFDFFNEQFNIGYDFYSRLIHAKTSIAKTAEISKGVIINPGVVIAPYSVLRNLVTVNRNVSIGHHTTIGSFCTIHPGVNIAGHCQIGKLVTVGMGANIIDGVSIGDYAVIGAGSLVTRDIPANVVAYGSPAQIIKQLQPTG